MTITNSNEIAELIEKLELLTGKKVTLSEKNLPPLKSQKIKVGRPSKITNPILAVIVHQVLYKAYYEEIVIKGKSRHLTITEACNQLAKSYISRRSPELGAFRLNIVDKTSLGKVPKTVVIANCARTIRRLYYEGYKKRFDDAYIASKIQGVHASTEQDRLNLQAPKKIIKS